jgi:cathepsin D
LIADTGTSLITGPSDAIYSLLGKVDVDNNCDSMQNLPDITFVANGISYTLKPEEYILKEDDAEMFLEA